MTSPLGSSEVSPLVRLVQQGQRMDCLQVLVRPPERQGPGAPPLRLAAAAPWHS
jgi:hypothetical protein